MSNYSKVSEYKISIWKLNIFLYTSNEQGEFDIKKCNTVYISM